MCIPYSTWDCNCHSVFVLYYAEIDVDTVAGVSELHGYMVSRSFNLMTP